MEVCGGGYVLIFPPKNLQKKNEKKYVFELNDDGDDQYDVDW